MREILFRGQTRRHGEKVNMAGDKLPGRWVYGGVLQGTGDYSIIYGGENLDDIEKHTVYTDTIGQYTGRDVKTGKVFEGDIGKSRDGIFLVVWNENTSAHMLQFYDPLAELLYLEEMWDDSEIIGNIHDNPELKGDSHEQKS